MADNLTNRIQRQLKERGTVATATQINNALKKLSGESEDPLDYGGIFNPAITPEPEEEQPQPQPKQNLLQQFISETEQSGVKEAGDSGSILNAVGAGLWTFADTAAFGIPGAFTKEEEFIDFDDPYAKWTSAVGGFAGYVGGGPMRLGTKILQQASKVAIKGTGKKHVDEVIKGMAFRGKEKGLDQKTINEVTGGYKSLVQKSQINVNIRGPEFKNRAEDYLNAYVQRGVSTGALNPREAAAVQRMFDESVFTRPLQDFFGIIAQRGILAQSPNAQRVLAHAVNDAVMFGLIDTGFEAISVLEDGEFDWTHPVWGLATGVAFSQLAWLKPKGNAASWKKDFMHGLKGAFGRKDIYKKLNRSQLDATASFFGEMRVKQRPLDPATGEVITKNMAEMVDITYKGKTALGIKLNDRTGVLEQLRGTFKGESQDALISFLEKEKRKAGKELMSFANKEALANFAEVWPRMLYGGVLFNLHSFHQMAFNEAEMGVNEILPHFLIGAWIQRHSNPSKFDMSGKSINQLRANLMTLGMGPGQLNGIPTFNERRASFDTPFKDSNLSVVHEKAVELGIISDTPEIITPLKKGEASIAMPEHENLKFKAVWEELSQFRESSLIKDYNEISVKEANEIMEALYKVEPSLRKATVEDVLYRFDKGRISGTKGFEDSFLEVVEQVQRLDENQELGIIPRTNNDPGRIPSRIDISDALKKRINNGEFDWILGKDGESLAPREALAEIVNKIAGFNSIMQTTELIGLKKLNPKKSEQRKNIESVDMLRKVYETVKDAESRIQEQFPETRHLVDKFSYHDSFGDYIEVLGRNAARRNAEAISEIFRPGYREQNQVAQQLIEVGILRQGVDDKEAVIISDIKNIRIDESTFENNKDMGDVAEARRFLGRLLTIQSVSGGYKRIAKSKETKSDTMITAEQIFGMKQFLTDRGFEVNATLQKDWMHNQIVDYIIQDKIQKTNLSVEDVDSLFALSELNMVSFGAAVEGAPAGFSIKKIDVENSIFKKGDLQYEIAVDYNQKVDKIEDLGKGLVVVEEGSVKILEEGMMSLIHDRIESVYGRADSAISLTKFLTILQSSGKSNDVFRRQIESFISDDPYAANRLNQWLRAAGIIKKRKGDGKGVYKMSIDKLTPELKDEISKQMDMYGHTQEAAKLKYEEIEQQAREILNRPSDESDTSKQITIVDFWKKYRENGVDYTDGTSIDMAYKFKNMIYSDESKFLLNDEIIRKTLNKMWIKDAKGDWIKLNPTLKEIKDFKLKGQKVITKREADKLSRIFFDEFVSLLTRQRGQVITDVVKYKHGQVEINKEPVQFSRLNLTYDNLDIKPIIIDPMAPVYLTVDNRYVVKKNIDLFGDSQNLDKQTRDQVKSQKSEFISVMNSLRKMPGADGAPVDEGLSVFRIGKGIESIAIERTQLKNLHDPFNDFYNKYKDDDRLSVKHRNEMERIVNKTKAQDGRTEGFKPVVDAEYEYMLKRLVHRDMLVGSDGDQFFIDFMNGKNSNKISGRIKLFHTKKFTKLDRDYIGELAAGNLFLKRKDVARNIYKYYQKNNFGVSIWNDEGYNTVRQEVEAQIKNLGLEDKYSYDDIIGDAHKNVSSFDSIAFISRDMMQFSHSVLGHNPNSTNPLKPVLSSGGENAPLLLGKTLFVYSKHLDSFFDNNSKVDILISKSGAKAFNEKIGNDGKDKSMINRSWQYISGNKKTYSMSEEKIRYIPLDSVGLMANADKTHVDASVGMADYNYANNFESGEIFKSMYADPLRNNLDNFKTIVDDPIAMRQFMLTTLGDDGIVPDISANQGLNHINNMLFYSSLSQYSNPMSYSPNMTRNKIYSRFINNMINNNRSTLSMHDRSSSDSYGGQSILIQSPDIKNRLLSTFVNKEGEMLQRGEILLPHHQQFVSMDKLSQNGFELRFTGGDGNKDILNIENVANALADNNNISKKKREKYIDDTIDYMKNETLAELHSLIEDINSQLNSNYKIAIMVNRKPRTRPNDFAIMSLKGFLEKTHGNSVQLGSLDVVNVFEGDYDVDKADYFFMHKPEMFDHLQRTQDFWVQAADPSDLMIKKDFNFDDTASNEKTNWWNMIADSEVYKKSVGTVQKVPRALGAIEKVGVRTSWNDPFLMGMGYDLQRTVKKVEKGIVTEEKTSPRLLFGRAEDNFRIFMDYEGLDYFNRSAIETQMILDGDGKLNPDIAKDIISWRDEFLFPSKSQSIGMETAKKQIGFLNQQRKSGTGPGKKRVRIFRKIVHRPDGTYQEVDLSSLEKAAIKEMFNEYNSFLNATGKTLWENSGENRAPKFDDVISAGEQWRNFNSNINDNLYYALRNRRNPDNGKKWKTNEEFKKFFGVKEKTFKKKKKDIPYQRPTRKITSEGVGKRGINVASGVGGSVIDRIIINLVNEDVYNQTRAKGQTGAVVDLMDSWYSKMNKGDDSTELDRFQQKFKDGAYKFNQTVNLIKTLKKKWVQVGNNEKIPFKIRKQSQEKINKFIKDLEDQISELLPKKYLKTKKAKHLKSFKYVSIEKDDLKEGSIQYATIDGVQSILPNQGVLKQTAREDLKEIRQLRKLFYSNMTNLKDAIEYINDTGIVQTFNRDTIEFLKSMPDLSTFYDVEHSLLERGFKKYGSGFIYEFMKPIQSKYDIGVYEGKLHSIPYQSSKTYKRGLQFLTKNAMESMKEGDFTSANESKLALIYMATLESQYYKYFNRKFDQKGLLSTQFDPLSDLPILDMGGRPIVLGDVKLPDFNKGVRNALTSFDRIKWNRDKARTSNGLNIMNDHWIDLYKNIAMLTGRESEFQSYLDSMSDINAQMIGNGIVDPMWYLSERSKLDSDLKRMAREQLVNPDVMNQDNIYVKNIKNNPIYALMGGGNFYKGISLERKSDFSVKRLREQQRMFNKLHEYKQTLQPRNEKTKSKELDDILLNCT